MDKLRMTSANGVQDNIKKIEALFPDCVTETIDADGKLVRKVDFEKLQQNLSDFLISDREERYQFTWPDKKKAVLLANAPINATLRPCREESVDFDNTQNLYIEGENLDVLKCLKETYLHQVKMIYIDPPYNTGNDFVYEDDFAESAEEYRANSGQYDNQGNRLVANTESNGRFHTDWLNMIYPRLKVARDLLTDNGVIFISINDVEITNLRKVCDELFGRENCIAQVVWKNKYGAGGGTNSVAMIHEYILIYSKKPIESISCDLSDDLISAYKFKDEQFETRGGYVTQPLASTSKGARVNLMYPIEHNGETILPPKGGRWIWSKEKFLEAYNNNEIVINKTSNGHSVRFKQYLKDESGNMRKGTQLSIIADVFNQEGTKDFADIMEDKRIFDFPKPINLIKKLIKFDINGQDSKDSIIVDFFSGSAATAHAVMQLNAEDGGNRKFILVQLPELTDEKSEAYKAGYKNICEIGKERIRRAGKKILEEQKAKSAEGTLFEGQEKAQKLDIGFRVLKLDSTNMQDIYYSPADTNQADLFSMVDNVKPDRTPEDLLFQVMLELGATLDSKIERMTIEGKSVFNVANGFIVACFDKDVSDKVVTAIAKKQPLYAVIRDTSMADDSTATNFEQIFKTYSPNTTIKII